MNHLKFNPDESSKIWITSDFHFSHKNIIKSTSSWQYKDICREFDSVDHHDQYLVYLINKYVKYNHTLIFAGDWSFAGFENIEKFYWQLECHNIHFVLGNHDHHVEKNKENIQKLFLSVQDRLHIEIGDRNFIVQHIPLETWEGIFKGWFHLFGHQHSNRIGPGRKMDIGIDKAGNLYKPYNIDEILEILEPIEIQGGIGDSNIEVETKLKRK